MKKVLHLSLLFFCISAFSQVPEIQWQKSFGGSLYEKAASMKQTIDGGYIVLGSAKSTDGDVTGGHGMEDFWVVKTDSNGTIEWKKALGGSQSDIAHSIIQTSDGNYMVLGAVDSHNGDISGGTGQRDLWVVKLDTDGNLVWQKVFGGNWYSDGNDIKATPDGGFIIAADTSTLVNGSPTFDAWLIKTDGLGNIVWEKKYGGSANDTFNSVQLTSDGGYIAAGFTRSPNNGDVTGNHGSADYWVVKTDASGTIQWQKCYGGSYGDGAQRIKTTSDGGYIIIGSGGSNDGDITEYDGWGFYWVVKIDATGNIQWQRTLTGSQGSSGDDVLQTTDGGYIVSGIAYTFQNFGLFHSPTSAEGLEIGLAKLSPDGQILWIKLMGGLFEDYTNEMIQTADGGFAIAGTSYLAQHDNTVSYSGDSNYWIIKLSGETLNADIFSKSAFSVYPNPAASVLHFQLPQGTQIDKIEITDTSGKLISQQSGNLSQVNIANLASGMYFIECFSGNQKFQTKFIRE